MNFGQPFGKNDLNNNGLLKFKFEHETVKVPKSLTTYSRFFMRSGAKVCNGSFLLKTHKCKSCRSHQELPKFLNSIEYLLAKFGFDTAENESLKVCQIIAKSWNKS